MADQNHDMKSVLKGKLFYILYFFIGVGIFLIPASQVRAYTYNCTGSAEAICKGGGAVQNQIKISYSIEQYSTPLGCNAYLSGGSGDQNIGTDCSVSNKTIISYKGAEIPDNATFQLKVSNGAQLYDCFNKTVENITFNCSTSTQPPNSPTPTVRISPTSSPAATTVPGATVAPGDGQCYVCDGGWWRPGFNCKPAAQLPVCKSKDPTTFGECSGGDATNVTDSGQKSCGTGTAQPTTAPTAPASTSAPTTHTTRFRVAETEAGLESAAWQTFIGTTVPFTFTGNYKEGDTMWVYVQFESSNNGEKTQKPYARSSIKYIGTGPQITRAYCHFGLSGQGTDIELYGLNFGDHDIEGQGTAKVKIAGREARIKMWQSYIPSSPTPVSSISATPTSNLLGESTASAYRVLAHLNESVPTNTKIPVVLVNDSGRGSEASCIIDTTTAELTVKPLCRSGSLALENVSVTLKEAIAGAKPLFNKIVKVDADGKISDLNMTLEKGLVYTVVVKGPQSIAKKIPFRGEEGTMVLPPINLPVGDIAPSANPDCKINALDRSELIRQWNNVSDTVRAGDLNQDGRVNSLDWSCMKKSFNQSCDE